MTSERATYEPLPESVRASVESMLAFLKAYDEEGGGFTTKFEARLTGFSLHAKFDRKVVDWQTTAKLVGILGESPWLLIELCERILAAENDLRNAGTTTAWLRDQMRYECERRDARIAELEGTDG